MRTTFKNRGRILSALTPKNLLVSILVISVSVRLAAALYLGTQVVELPGTADQVSYHTLAQRVLSGAGFTFDRPWWPLTQAGAPTAHWSFAYTGFLTGLYALFGVNALVPRLLQALLVGLCQPYLAYLLGKRVFGTPAGLWAAGATALYTYFIYYAAALMTEPFYITAVLAMLYLTIRLGDELAHSKHSVGRFVWLAACLGLVVGLAALLRQLILLFVPFLFIWLWLVQWAGRGVPALPEGPTGLRTIPWGRFVSALVLVIVVLLALILPFTAYNQARFGQFVLLNTNAGYAFFWGNHPVYGTHFQPILPPEMGTYLDLIPPELRQLDEAALDQALLRRGLQFVFDDPLRYLLLSLSRIPAYFMFWPSPASGLLSNLSRVGGFGLFLPFMLAGIWLGVRQAWSRVRAAAKPARLAWLRFAALPESLLLLFVVVYSGIHILSWALVRYRLPVDAVLLVFAGLALHNLVGWFLKRKERAA